MPYDTKKINKTEKENLENNFYMTKIKLLHKKIILY